MLEVGEITCRTLINRSHLPGNPFVINPYRGCAHGCAYCYVQNMPQVSDSKRKWGSYVDVKINALNVLPRNLAKFYHQSIYMSSVTDCYQPLEKDYRLTRRILERLVVAQPALTIQTKSALVLRDLDILRQFKLATVGMTIITLNEDLRQKLEPGADSITNRLTALQALHAAGITTYVFIGPLLPFLTDWRAVVNATHSFTDYYYFDWLNTRGCLWRAIISWIKRFHPELVERYQSIYAMPEPFWENIRREIEAFCLQQQIQSIICF